MPRVHPQVESKDGRSAKSRVLRAANKLFAANGFRGTSVRQIASRARVNEVTIFRLFSSKRALYKEVLESKLKTIPPVWIPADLTAEDSQTFCSLAAELQEAFNPEFMRLLFFAALEDPEAVRKSWSPRINSFYGVISDHIQKRMDCGAIREADPKLMAKALIALIVYDRISNDFLTDDTMPREEFQAHTTSLLDIWLHGVARVERLA